MILIDFYVKIDLLVILSFLKLVIICTVHSGLEWASERLTKVCPPKKRKKCTKPEKIEEEINIGPPCTERQPYIPPSQICPTIDSCCYIKMQVQNQTH